MSGPIIIVMLALSPPSYFIPGVPSPVFIQPAHGHDNFRRSDAPDLSLPDLLPAFPSDETAGEIESWAAWENWHLALALLPKRDTVNGEYFDLRDIAPCVGICSTCRISAVAKRLYPNWEGRYRFRLVHVLRVVKSYLRDGNKRHSREELIRRVSEKHCNAKKAL